MNNSPLVSVIIPNYNHARYLDQRIQTVLNQTYQNFEVIILDDKSTDNSLEVIAKYKDNPHVSQIVVNEQNSGSTFKQWDKGIHLAKGELIWIAESDDYCELNMLEELIKEWTKTDYPVAAHVGYVLFDDNESFISKSKERKNKTYRGESFVKKRMARGCVFRNASGAIFKKECAKLLSTEYQSYKSTGDYLFWTQICAMGKVIEVHKNLTYNRIHMGSVTSNNYTKGITALEDKRVYDYIMSHWKLNWWQKEMALASHYSLYTNTNYDNEDIRSTILSTWGLSNRSQIIDKILLWFCGTLERHFGILI